MNITVPLFGIVVLIVVLHTILQHLFNWFVRKSWQMTGGEGLVFVTAVFTIFEFVICLAVLNNYIP